MTGGDERPVDEMVRRDESMADDAPQVADDEPQLHRVTVLRLGQELFGVADRQSKGIFQIESLTRIPLTPPHLLGVTNLHGQITPVVDFSVPLAAKRSVETESVGLIMEAKGMRVVWVVDDLVAFEPTNLDDLAAIDATSAEGREFALGSWQLAGETVTVVDAERLIDALRIREQRTESSPRNVE